MLYIKTAVKDIGEWLSVLVISRKQLIKECPQDEMMGGPVSHTKKSIMHSTGSSRSWSNSCHRSSSNSSCQSRAYITVSLILFQRCTYQSRSRFSNAITNTFTSLKFFISGVREVNTSSTRVVQKQKVYLLDSLPGILWLIRPHIYIPSAMRIP